MEWWRVVVEVVLSPGVTAEAEVFVESDGEAGAKVLALETMAWRLSVKSAEVTG